MSTAIDGSRLIRFSDAAEHYEVPQHIELIDDLAFAGSGSLISLMIPDSVREIGNYAFAECYSLREIRLPSQVSRIGAGLFRKCWNLREVRFPEGLKLIGGEMFEGCHALEELYLPQSLALVERTAFSTCRKIRRIHIDPVKMKILPPSARYTAVLTYMEDHLPEEGSDIIDGFVEGRNRSFLDLAVNRRSTKAVRYLLGRDLITQTALDDYLIRSADTGRIEITAMLLDHIRDNHTDGLDTDPFR